MSYSPTKATLALAKANFRSILRSPSAIIFTVVFPIVFILAFELMSGGKIKIDVGVSPHSDTQNPIFESLKSNPIFKIEENLKAATIEDRLQKGSLDAVINVTQSNTAPKYKVNIQYAVSARDKVGILNAYLVEVLQKSNPNPNIEIHQAIIQAPIHRSIDFILPGQIGFSLLSTGIFGTAFVFFSLRQTLVIKRLFATPINRFSIILGETLARIVFSLLGVLFLVIIGHLFFHFTLIHGVITVFNMLLVSALALVVFMGFGFVISGIAKSESTIPPISNIITLPQFLLSGVFFPIEVFPKWIQPFCELLPLTHFNIALRKIAFDGVSIFGVWQELLYIGIWGLLVYALAVKVFKWE